MASYLDFANKPSSNERHCFLMVVTEYFIMLLIEATIDQIKLKLWNVEKKI